MKDFRKYSDLISCLLVAEQNNELLMKNHEAYPTGSAPFPEVNVAAHNKSEVVTMAVDVGVARDGIITAIIVEISKRTMRALKITLQRVKIIYAIDVI